MSKSLKILTLHMLKYVGMFALARVLTRRGVRILCYHAIGVEDEPQFRPKLFMSSPTFHRRMALLRKWGFPVIRLDKVISGLRAGTLPHCATVITIDDGWLSTYRQAVPVLREFGLAATIYVTTYYVRNNAPIFNVLCAYALWRTTADQLVLPDWEAVGGPWNLRGQAGRERCLAALIAYADDHLTAEQRLRFTRSVIDGLGLDWEAINSDRRFQLMSEEEVRNVAEAGFDVQLHTHRHRLPRGPAAAQQEIVENRAVLAPLVRARLDHFCYPSGIYDPEQWPWLEELGIESATTCLPGLNYQDVPRFELRRILDGEDVADIEFEAELSGALDLARRIMRWRVGAADVYRMKWA